MIWRGLILILLLAIGGAAIFLMTRSGRELLDRVEIDWIRHQHRARFAQGLPLAGTPDLGRLDQRLAAKGVKLGAPVFLRIFKLESRAELWMQKDGTADGHYVLVATYPICFWSGQLGPKLASGDSQAPEGYYTIDKGQLNPKSHWYRAFNLGFPNAFDAAHGRTGSYLMMHGGCSSIGCYAMTNQVIGEIWTIVTAALNAGQPRVAVEALPFRMSGRNLDWRRSERWSGFWSDLKTGSDLFEATHIPPVASVCQGRYAFARGVKDAPVPPVAVRCPPPLAANP